MSTRLTMAQVEAQNRKVAEGKKVQSFAEETAEYQKAVENFAASVKTKYFMVKTAPVAAPRMTRSDRWKDRPCVLRYFEFRDKVRDVVGDIPVTPDTVNCEFYIAMPDSWSKKKKAEMAGKPHRDSRRFDCDNLFKAVSDSLFINDGSVWSASQKKFWCNAGEERVCITMIWL